MAHKVHAGFFCFLDFHRGVKRETVLRGVKVSTAAERFSLRGKRFLRCVKVFQRGGNLL